MWKFFSAELKGNHNEPAKEDTTDESKFELLGPVGEKLSTPECISVSLTGELVVSDSESCFIVIYNSFGNYMTHFSTLPKQNFYFFLDIDRYKPHDVAWLSSRKIAYTQPKGCKITVSDWKGKASMCVEGKPLYEPYSLTVDKTDNIFVTDREKGRLLCFNTEGKLIRSIGVFGSGNMSLNIPHYICISKHGYIYINDIQKGKVVIHIFDPNKNSCETILTNIDSKDEKIGQFTIDENDRILQVDTNEDSINVFNTDDRENNDSVLYPLSKIYIVKDISGITFNNNSDLLCIDRSSVEVKTHPWKIVTEVNCNEHE